MQTISQFTIASEYSLFSFIEYLLPMLGNALLGMFVALPADFLVIFGAVILSWWAIKYRTKKTVKVTKINLDQEINSSELQEYMQMFEEIKKDLESMRKSKANELQGELRDR